MAINVTHECAEADRYLYDQLLFKNGYAQINTTDDASYYGTWASIKDLIIFSYVEGDCTTTTCDTLDEFVSTIYEIFRWMKRQKIWIGIDVGSNDSDLDAWVDAGLSNLLSGNFEKLY